MEGATPAAALPAPGRPLLPWVGRAAWLVVAVLAAAGAGVLAVANEQLAVDLAVVAVAAVALYAYPFPALLFVLLFAPKRSPFVELCFMAAAAIVVLWRLPFLPGRSALLPLFLFLAVALPGVAWDSGFVGGAFLNGAAAPDLYLPGGVGVAFLETPTVEGFEWLRLAFVLGVALVAAWQCTSVQRFRLVVGAAILGAVYPLATGMDQLVSGQFVAKDEFSAVRGSFSFPNEFGLFLVLFLLVAIVALFELRERWMKIATGVLVAAALLMLLHSYTRAAWIAFALGLVVIAVVRYRSLIAVSLLALVVAAVGFPGAVRDVQARFGDLASQNAANSKNSLKWRRGQWEAMWHYGSEKPLTGQGLGSYRRKTVEEFGLESRTYGTVERRADGGVALGFTAHNDYVKAWVETGGTGLLLWVGALAGLAVIQIRAMRVRALAPWGAALLGGTIAVVVMSASDNVQGYTVPLVYLFGLTAALAGAANAARISSAKRPSS